MEKTKRLNKKRNTAFLYEVLIRELTKSILNKEEEKQKNIVSLLKEFFHDKTILGKELELYKNIYESGDLEKQLLKTLIEETKKSYSKLNFKDVFNKQSKLINKVNKEIGKNIFNNFIPNYKTLASIYQIFNEKTPLKTRCILENQIIEQLIKKEVKEEKNIDKVDKLSYKIFIEKFNEIYGETLNKNQKKLMERYILSFSENDIDYKMFLNDEIKRLKETVNKYKSYDIVEKDKYILEKIVEVENILNDCAKKPINEEELRLLLKIQQLEEEFEKNDDQN